MGPLDQRAMANYLDEPPAFEEFITAVRQQKERKAPSRENGIAAEAYKYMDDENSELIYKLLLLYRQNREYDIDEWHYSILNLIAKKGTCHCRRTGDLSTSLTLYQRFPALLSKRDMTSIWQK